MKASRVALYIRVSRTDQKFDSQESELLAYCKRRGWKRPFLIYREKVSGAKASRTELDRLMKDARAGRIDIVAVYKMDRLGRSLSHLLQICRELAGLQISIVCSSQGIDTTGGGAAANLQLSVLGAMAEFERELIQERTAAGLASARRRGKKLGRPRFSDAIRAKILELRKPARNGRQMSLDEIARITKTSRAFVWNIINGPSKKGPPVKAKSAPGKSPLHKVTVL